MSVALITDIINLTLNSPTYRPKTSSPLTPAAQVESARVRYDFLDGLRGLTSLYVVLAHVGIMVDRQGVWPPVVWLLDLTRAGHSAVSIFIVLSGYCLMLPVARSPGAAGGPDSLGGFWPYLLRRGRRILPPYYAALGFSLLLMAMISSDRGGHWWGTMRPAFTPGVLASHLLLLHNLDDAWIFKINAPMWSVATEWQIYFLFPLALLPIYRRMGGMAAVIAGVLIGLSPLYFFRRFESAAPWFCGLFALGMYAAGQSRPGLMGDVWRGRWPWGWVSLALGALLALLLIRGDRLAIHGNWKFQFIVDMLGGACVAAFLAWAARRADAVHVRTQRPSFIIGFLSAKWATALGGFSYSLYLTHAPVAGRSKCLVGGPDDGEHRPRGDISDDWNGPVAGRGVRVSHSI